MSINPRNLENNNTPSYRNGWKGKKENKKILAAGNKPFEKWTVQSPQCNVTGDSLQTVNLHSEIPP
jgi:hypothetical protein